MKPPKLFISEMNFEMEMKLKNELEMKRRNDTEMNNRNEHTFHRGNEPKIKTRLEMNNNVEMNHKKED